ncbi:MAG: efflux RND transporter periplasmic adaptor subunit [Verrucomicrobiota bacterium]
MKRVLFFLGWAAPLAAVPDVILTPTQASNLAIETEVVEIGDFEETVFAVGRIEAKPQNQAVLSSRIPGRVLRMAAFEGDEVEAGQEIFWIESRQPGDPPPQVSLAAPLSGLVTSTELRVGDPVEPSKELLTIQDLSRVWAIARIPEHAAGSLKLGSQAHIRVPALGEESLSGTLLRFGTQADRDAGTLDAIYEVENPGGRLRPGMRVEFHAVLRTHGGVFVVPESALQGDETDRHLWIPDYDLPTAYHRTPVRVGRRNGEQVEILEGVFPGDMVVVKGGYALGFAGAGGMSLKEALDAAHGHEHAEDGSEMAEAEKAVESTAPEERAEESGWAGALFPWLVGYSLLATLVAVFLAQQLAGSRP